MKSNIYKNMNIVGFLTPFTVEKWGVKQATLTMAIGGISDKNFHQQEWPLRGFYVTVHGCATWVLIRVGLNQPSFFLLNYTDYIE